MFLETSVKHSEKTIIAISMNGMINYSRKEKNLALITIQLHISMKIGTFLEIMLMLLKNLGLEILLNGV